MKPAHHFAARWSISTHEIRRLCAAGRIPGAVQEIIRGRTTWLIPEDAVKPGPGKPGPKSKTRP